MERKIIKVKMKDRDYKTSVRAVNLDDMTHVVQEIEKGADVNMKFKYNNTLLHFCKSPDMASYLIRKGADVNAVNNSYNTPLHTMVKKGLHEVIDTLLMYNADTSIENYNGCTPLMSCFDIPTCRVEIIESLLNYEIDVNRVNDKGETVLKKALIKKSPYIENIIQHGGNFKNILYDSSMLTWCAGRLVSLEEFEWFWDIYKYKESWNSHRSILNTLLDDRQCSKLDYVIQSEKIEDVLHVMYNNTETTGYGERDYLLCDIMEAVHRCDYCKTKAEEAISILLSFGFVVLSEYDAINIFKMFGNSFLFKSLLHMDMREDTCLSELDHRCLLPTIMLNPQMCVKSLTRYCLDSSYHASECSLIILSSYISDDKLIEILESYPGCSNLSKKLRQRNVPSLLELSRNQARLAIWKGYKLENRGQFYTVIRWMKIPPRIEDIIRFEFPIYDLSKENRS